MSVEPAFGVNAVCPVLQVPRLIVMLPVPTTAVASLKAPAAPTTDCVAESELTETE